MKFSLKCGRYSFSEIPFKFDKILGVSGTLEQISEYEKNIIKNYYKINLFTITPSMFKKNKPKFDQ